MLAECHTLGELGAPVACWGVSFRCILVLLSNLGHSCHCAVLATRRPPHQVPVPAAAHGGTAAVAGSIKGRGRHSSQVCLPSCEHTPVIACPAWRPHEPAYVPWPLFQALRCRSRSFCRKSRQLPGGTPIYLFPYRLFEHF